MRRAGGRQPARRRHSGRRNLTFPAAKYDEQVSAILEDRYMFEDLLTANPWLPIPLLGIVGGTLVAVVAIIAGCRTSARRLELETKLKHDMLTRGMPAAEIERVIRASSGSDPEPVEAPKPTPDNEYALI